MSITPTQRTLAVMKKKGRICGIVERFVSKIGPHGKRIDLFGFIDIIAIDPEEGIVAIQSCGSAFAEHLKKMTQDTEVLMKLWLNHARVELWGWRKVKYKRGSKAVRWRPRIVSFYLEDNEIKYTYLIV